MRGTYAGVTDVVLHDLGFVEPAEVPVVQGLGKIPVV